MFEQLRGFELSVKHWIGIVLGLVVMILGMIFFSGLKDKSMMYFLIVLGFVIVALPFILSMVGGQESEKEKEEMFLAFSRDLVENVRSGTPISKSILNLRNRNYGALTPHVQKLSNQLSMGFTLSEGLENFAKESGSSTIRRAVGLISQAERAGGKIESILESVANSINQIETLKKERKASVSNLVTQGYIIFVVFIVIMLVLEFKIMPLVTGLTQIEGVGGSAAAGLSVGGSSNTGDFAKPLFLMLIVQSIFAGLVIGKISDGSIKAGIKHSFILLALTLLVSTGARAFLGEPGAKDTAELFLVMLS